MGWAVGYDPKWKRDIGYGVPAVCDYPGCGVSIDRGLTHVCGGAPYGGEEGCGLYFCGEHLYIPQECFRCGDGKEPFAPTPDVPEWIEHKLTDDSWAEWRSEHPEEVAEMQAHRGAAEVTSLVFGGQTTEVGR